MGEIFRSFIAGREAGEDRRQRQTQRTALEEAGQLYGLGKTDAAENALVGAGMPDVAANYSALGEARRARQTRQRATQAAEELGPKATPTARIGAMADAYLDDGDPEQARALQEYSNSIDDRQRQNDLQRLAFTGSIQASLQEVPMEQRLARVRELIAQSPYANDPHMQALADDDTTDLSDEALNAGARATMSAESTLAGRERQQRYAVEDSHWGQEMGLRRAALAQSGPNAPLTSRDARVYGHEYDVAQRNNIEQLGIMRASLPYAFALAASRGETPEGMTPRDISVADIGLLRGAARSQTGPGVLTSTEVLQTLTPNLQRQIREQGAYFNPASVTLNAEDRAALARYVVQSARDVGRDAWNTYEDYRVRLPDSTSPEALGMRAPWIVHPDDLALATNPNANYEVGQEYVGGDGRVYRNNGPGNWEYRRQGRARVGAEGGAMVGGAPPPPATPEAPPSAPLEAPPVGTMDGNYRFRGGDPRNRSNWEDVRQMQPGYYRGR